MGKKGPGSKNEDFFFFCLFWYENGNNDVEIRLS